MTEVVLKDASIIIDLIKVNLLQETLNLPYIFYTTDFIIAEITDEQQSILLGKFIKNNYLKIVEATDEDLLEKVN